MDGELERYGGVAAYGVEGVVGGSSGGCVDGVVPKIGVAGGVGKRGGGSG